MISIQTSKQYQPLSMATSTPALSSQLETLSYLNGMVEAFRAFDSDGDGLVSAAELGGLMSSLGYSMSGQEVQEMMGRVDADGDGFMSAAEFLEIVTEHVELDVGELAGMLEGALSVLDADVGGSAGAGAGAVTGEELYEVLRCMGRLSVKDCMDVVASMDGDGDGAVDIEDLRLIVQALT